MAVCRICANVAFRIEYIGYLPYGSQVVEADQPASVSVTMRRTSTLVEIQGSRCSRSSFQVYGYAPFDQPPCNGENEHNFVAILQLVFALAFQLPVGIIDQDKDSGRL